MTSQQRAPAKLNLWLRVLGLRPDGSHEVDTLLQAIDLADRLSITPAPESTVVAEGDFAVPTGPENLVLRAAAESGLTARFLLHKSIPPGAGLGGGSSDAAAVLRASGRAMAELESVAARLGADVPFFLRGGRALATGRGELLQPLAAEPAWFALAWPGYEVSTAAVYRAWDEVGGEGRNHLFRAACAIEPRLVKFAEELGEGWVMTGSGSAFFKEARSEAEARQLAGGRAGWAAVARALEAWA